MAELIIRHMDDSRTDIDVGGPGGPWSWSHTSSGLVLRWSPGGQWKVFPLATVKSYLVVPNGAPPHA